MLAWLIPAALALGLLGLTRVRPSCRFWFCDGPNKLVGRTCASCGKHLEPDYDQGFFS
jgi:hypothetical protein